MISPTKSCTNGSAANFRSNVLVAGGMCVLLAVVLDVAVLLVQRSITPWTRARA